MNLELLASRTDGVTRLHVSFFRSGCQVSYASCGIIIGSCVNASFISLAFVVITIEASQLAT